MDEPAPGKSRTLFQGRHLELAAVGKWEFVQRLRGSPVGIAAVTPEGNLLLISQFRVPVGRTVVEIPAGLAGDGADESWEAAAARELREETGWTAENFEKLTEGPTSAGLTSECVMLVRATELTKAGPQEPDGDEQITVHEVPMAEVVPWLRARESEGMLIDPKVWAGLYFLKA
jgi:ADP-ribose pyrophosphatase